MVQKELSPLISRWFCSANRKLTEKARGIRTAFWCVISIQTGISAGIQKGICQRC